MSTRTPVEQWSNHHCGCLCIGQPYVGLLAPRSCICSHRTDKELQSGPARGFWYTVSWVFLAKVFGIFLPKYGYKVFCLPEFLVFCI